MIAPGEADLRAITRALGSTSFAKLPVATRAEVAAGATVGVYEKGQAVYREGDSGDSVILVLEGELALVRNDDDEGDQTEPDAVLVGEGELAAIEAFLGVPRRATARAVLRSRIAALSAPLLRRALGRYGGEDALAELVRGVSRATIAALLARVPLGEGMSRADRVAFAAAVSPRRLSRGEGVARAGEAPTAGLLVVEGLIEARLPTSAGASGARVVGFLSPGDLGDHDVILEGRPRAYDYVASGGSLVADVPAREIRRLALVAPNALAAAGRLGLQKGEAGPALPLATRHAFHDVYRLEVARSLLVIDLETCVSCGHCAFSCASLHGVARIVRRGEALSSRDGDARARTLLLPSSCQHCELPSCMPACPTGAIGRDESGEVVIREELCTGCEACAKACPWDNIQLAPRRDHAKTKPIFLDGGGVARLAGQSESVAVKCDLCRGFEAPACVDGCPVDAIIRLAPDEAHAGVVSAANTPMTDPTLLVPPPRPAWPFVVASLFLAAGLVAFAEGARSTAHVGAARGVGLGAGIVSAVLLAWLFGYAIRKRWPRLFVRRRPTPARTETGRRRARSSVRAHTIAHLALGVLLPAIAFAHGGLPSLRSTGGVLAWALVGATMLGALAAAIYAVVPPRLARLSPTVRLPEELPRQRKLLEDRLFRELSGRSDLVKKIVEMRLAPYLRDPFGPAKLLFARRTRRQEREALRLDLDRTLQGRGKDKLGGLDALIETAVEHRALGASRLLSATLTAALPLHLVPAALVLALLIAHVLEVARR